MKRALSIIVLLAVLCLQSCAPLSAQGSEKVFDAAIYTSDIENKVSDLGWGGSFCYSGKNYYPVEGFAVADDSADSQILVSWSGSMLLFGPTTYKSDIIDNPLYIYSPKAESTLTYVCFRDDFDYTAAKYDILGTSETITFSDAMVLCGYYTTDYSKENKIVMRLQENKNLVFRINVFLDDGVWYARPDNENSELCLNTYKVSEGFIQLLKSNGLLA